MSSTTRIARLAVPVGLLCAIAGAAGAQTPQRPAQPRPAAPAPVQAQQQPAQPAAPAQQGGALQGQQAQTGPLIVNVKAEPSQTEWTKVCGKDPANNAEICYTTRDFVSDQGQPVLATAVYDVKGAQSQKVVRFLMPLGLLLKPGIRFAVDQSSPLAGTYTICFPNGCFAETVGLKDDLVAAMKKGTNINVSVQNQVGREVTFVVPLAGFAKAFDGAPIDPKVLEEQQKRLQDELEKRSEELRKRLEQSNAGGAAAPAAGGTPAPAAAGQPPRQ
ncbi:MAG: invasion associated locus B family protein [Methylobacteriaceae bacterium]|nr:invasion associated locus B family protein [Methylobacteriaceae bacterium]